MDLTLRSGGKELGPDVRAFIASLTLPQLAFIVNVYQYMLEGGPNILTECAAQLYMEAANRWNNDLTATQRRDAAHEGEERFFSEEARQQYLDLVRDSYEAARRAEEHFGIDPDDPTKGNGRNKMR